MQRGNASPPNSASTRHRRAAAAARRYHTAELMLHTAVSAGSLQRSVADSSSPSSTPVRSNVPHSRHTPSKVHLGRITDSLSRQRNSPVCNKRRSPPSKRRGGGGGSRGGGSPHSIGPFGSLRTAVRRSEASGTSSGQHHQQTAERFRFEYERRTSSHHHHHQHRVCAFCQWKSDASD